MSLFLALVMVCSLSVSAFAVGNETVITYTGAGTEAYTITVPTTLQPGQSGTVKAQGTWATNRTLKVTTANTVTVANSIDGGEKVLDVTFAGIDQAGDNTTSITVSKSISVGSISNALFGTWSGVITYNISMEDNGVATPTLISFTIAGTNYQAEEGMTWWDWYDSEYNTLGAVCDSPNTGVYFAIDEELYSVATESGDYPKRTDTIISGHNYLAV